MSQKPAPVAKTVPPTARNVGSKSGGKTRLNDVSPKIQRCKIDQAWRPEISTSRKETRRTTSNPMNVAQMPTRKQKNVLSRVFRWLTTRMCGLPRWKMKWGNEYCVLAIRSRDTAGRIDEPGGLRRKRMATSRESRCFFWDGRDRFFRRPLPASGYDELSSPRPRR